MNKKWELLQEMGHTEFLKDAAGILGQALLACEDLRAFPTVAQALIKRAGSQHKLPKYKRDRALRWVGRLAL